MSDELIRRLEKELEMDKLMAPRLVSEYARLNRMNDAFRCANDSELWESKREYLIAKGCPQKDTETLQTITDCALSCRLAPYLDDAIGEMERTTFQKIRAKLFGTPAQKIYHIYAYAESPPPGTFKPGYEHMLDLFNSQQFFHLLEVLQRETDFKPRKNQADEIPGGNFYINGVPISLEFTHETLPTWLRL